MKQKLNHVKIGFFLLTFSNFTFSYTFGILIDLQIYDIEFSTGYFWQE